MAVFSSLRCHRKPYFGKAKMSVMCENEYGWVLDHPAFWNKASSCIINLPVNKIVNQSKSTSPNETRTETSMIGLNTATGDIPQTEWKLNVKPDLFSIYQPFRMDSQFEKYAAKVKGEKMVDHQSAAEKRRQRKRKKPEEQESPDVIKLGHHLSKAHQSLVRLGYTLGHFRDVSSLPLNNNVGAREAAGTDDWDMGEGVPTYDSRLQIESVAAVDVEDGQVYTLADLSHRLCSWRGDSPAVITCGRGESPNLRCDDHYLIPPKASFFLSQADSLHAFVSALDGRKFDFIVIDPPWENKSVKRKKSYPMLSDWDMERLPVSELARPCCLVAVWVTNKRSQIELVKESLFLKWAVSYIGHWHWIKVTMGGEPVTDILSQGKKPYESLILGRYQPQCDTEQTGPQSDAGPQNNRPQDPPDSRVIVSVPCILHSKKPPLGDLLKPYCRSEPECLELFARNLQPGWTSWGNEVLRHQNLKFYSKT